MNLFQARLDTIDPRTTAAHYAHLEAGRYATTQSWSWPAQGDLPAGDAVVVVVNSLYDNREPYVFVRLGNTVHTGRRSIVAALQALGHEGGVGC